MSIINKINNLKNSLLKISEKEVQKVEPKNEMLVLVDKCAKVLNEMAERQVPENNKFRKVFVAFDLPSTRNEALISISHDEIEPIKLRQVAVQVHNINSDKFYSQFIFKGTKKECMDYIENKENHNIILDTAETLSKKVLEESNWL